MRREYYFQILIVYLPNNLYKDTKQVYDIKIALLVLYNIFICTILTDLSHPKGYNKFLKCVFISVR
jgi:hypothetical protein